jgi:hypothetical protein
MKAFRLALLACCVTAAAQETDEEAPAPKPKWYDGELRLDADAEWSGGGSDFDMDQTLRLNIDPPEYPKLRIRSSFWLHEDLGGDDDGIHADLYDAWDNDVEARVMHLYLEADDLWGNSTLRLGRQRIFEGPYFNRLDGIYFNKQMRKWNWYAYAGWRASYYQQSHDDPAYGGGVSVNLTPTTRVALDAYQVKEERRRYYVYRRRRFTDFLNDEFPRDVSRDFTDTSVSLSLWQDLTPNLRFFGAYRWHDGDGDEIHLELSGFVPAWQLSYELAYRKRLDVARDRPTDRTAYYRVLGRHDEYDSWFLAVHKPFFEFMTVSLEAEIRDVESTELRGANDRDFKRFGANLHFDEFFWMLDADLGAEIWDVDGAEEGWSINAELSRPFGKHEVALGAGYENYIDESFVYNFFPNWRNQVRIAVFRPPTPVLTNNFTVNWRDVYPLEAHEDIYSLYADWQWDLNESNAFNAGVTYEIDDSSESPYWRVKAGYTFKF